MSWPPLGLVGIIPLIGRRQCPGVNRRYKILSQGMTLGCQKGLWGGMENLLYQREMMGHGTEEILCRGDGVNNLVCLRGEEMEGEAPQMMAVGTMMKLKKKKETKQMKTQYP